MPKIKPDFGVPLLFLSSTVFFIWQHAKFWSWDFSVYLMNAQHFFSQGHFIEFARPPLASALMGLLHYAGGWKAAEFAYIIFASALFCFSAVRLADYLGIEKPLFYALELSPFALLFGTFAGTELLSLALLQLGLAYLSEHKGALSLSLAGLARYNNFIFALLLFLRKKNLLQRVFLFSLPVLVWLALNYFLYGSPWMSIADSYALNIKFREHNFSTVPLDFLMVIGWYFPFLFLGIRKAKRDKKFWVVVIFALLALFSYFRIPLKEARYLFNLILPVAFFSAIGLKGVCSKKLLAGIVIANFAIAVAVAPLLNFEPMSDLRSFKEASKKLECACASNGWVVFNRLGIPCEPAPRTEEFSNYINKGYRIVLYKHAEMPDYNYSEELVTEDAPQYIILGSEKCKEPLKNVSVSYLPKLSARGVNASYCGTLFGKLC